MARYYDLDKLSKLIEAKADTIIAGKEAMLYVAKWLNLLPAADVVEGVKCGQCKYYDCGRCNKHHIWIGDLNYCSFGTRTPQKEG